MSEKQKNNIILLNYILYYQKYSNPKYVYEKVYKIYFYEPVNKPVNKEDFEYFIYNQILIDEPYYKRVDVNIDFVDIIDIEYIDVVIDII